jgi:hypothetical protein
MSIVEDWSFVQLLRWFRSDVKPPGRQRIHDLLLDEHGSEEQRIKRFFISKSDLKV